MENATHALLIAGGILLGILTITMLVFMFANLNTIGTAQAEKQEADALTAWNAEWEAYNKQLLYGAQVLTVLNKAEQNNAEYDNDIKYTVDVTVVGMDKTEVRNHKTEVFRCTKMEYSSSTGRVKTIEFEFVE